MQDEIEFELDKGARATLSSLHAKIKELRAKRETIEGEMKKTQAEIEHFRLSEKPSATGGMKAKAGKKAKPKWHAEYLYFTTTSGALVVAGKNAKQNDELVAKHLGEDDLFFHADIQGAPSTILVGGRKTLNDAAEGNAAAVASLRETAQWAASYSSAWKTGAASVDVYAVSPSQVSKHAMGGYVGRGAFAIEGEREWFRATPLGLKAGVSGESPLFLPLCHQLQLEKQFPLLVGQDEKEATAKRLSALLSVPMDEIRGWLPSGKFSIRA